MTDEHDHDEYLWAGEGPISLEVAALERQLRPLSWTPRELALPGAATPIAIVNGEPQAERRPAPTDEGSRWWIPLAAGLAAAAAVFALVVGLRGASEPAPASEPSPAVAPAGRTSPDLVDPFARDAAPNPTPFPSPSTNSPDLKDPFERAPSASPPPPSSSADLVNPFADAAEPSSPPPPTPRPNNPYAADLQDPFKRGGTPDAKREPGKLYDPFTGAQRSPPSKSSPDLKDPFKR